MRFNDKLECTWTGEKLCLLSPTGRFQLWGRQEHQHILRDVLHLVSAIYMDHGRAGAALSDAMQTCKVPSLTYGGLKRYCLSFQHHEGSSQLAVSRRPCCQHSWHLACPCRLQSNQCKLLAVVQMQACYVKRAQASCAFRCSCTIAATTGIGATAWSRRPACSMAGQRYIRVYHIMSVAGSHPVSHAIYSHATAVTECTLEPHVYQSRMPGQHRQHVAAASFVCF